MGKRLSKIYTRTGDDGTTGLGDGTRTRKTAQRVEAMGDIDELNSHIGLLRAQLADCSQAQVLIAQLSLIQHDLFNLGGELAVPGYTLLSEQGPTALEQQIDQFNTQLPALDNFILPAGSLAIAQCHVCRSVCRRAERQLHRLAESGETLSNSALPYLNRLSDWLFVAAREIARLEGVAEVLWQPATGMSVQTDEA